MTTKEVMELYERYIQLKLNHGYKATAMGMYCEPIRMNKPMDSSVATEMDFIAKILIQTNSLHLLDKKKLKILANDERLGFRISEMLSRFNV